jgi:homoserine O-acetyltransferase
MSNAKTFILKEFELQCGAVLPAARLVYQTYGELASDRRNVILYPTSYGAQHSDIDWLIGPDRILDPSRWFIVIPNMLGNGLSSAPSNDPAVGLAEDGFWFTHWDNVRAQETLLRQVFGVDSLALVYGWSMGAQQAYHWGALYPDRVERIVALCGTARTTEHNTIFLQSLRAALTADPAWDGRRFQAVHPIAVCAPMPASTPVGPLPRGSIAIASTSPWAIRIWKTTWCGLGSQLPPARSP